MDYLENGYGERKPLSKLVFSKETIFFVAAYVVYLGLSFLQTYSGEIILQESGDLNSVTSYDYILPVIASLFNLVSLLVFSACGFFVYSKDKIRMLRFPMVFSVSQIAGTYLSSLFMALSSSPFIDFTDLSFNIIKVQSLAVTALKVIISLVCLIYFNSETDSYCYYEDYYAEYYSSPKKLRNRILSHKLSLLWVVIIAMLGSLVAATVARSAFIAVLSFVPEELLWFSYYIEVLYDTVYYGLHIVFAVYFTKDKRVSAKLIGIICLVAQLMKTFSFIFNSITNVFSDAGDNLLNSVLSSIAVDLVTFLFSVLKIIIVLLLCYRLKKSREY